MKKINKEDLELAKEVQYWAGRLIGCENAYDIAEEIVNTIKYAESEINDVDLANVSKSFTEKQMDDSYDKGFNDGVGSNMVK